MGTMTDECPVRQLLEQISQVLELMRRILDHCEKCGGPKDGESS